MKSRTFAVVSLVLVAILVVTGMTACTRAKPVRPPIAEAPPTSVPGAGVDVEPTTEGPSVTVSKVEVTKIEVVAAPDAASTAESVSEVPPGEVMEITPLPLEPPPTAVPGMPTPTVPGESIVEIPTPAVALIIPLTPEVELPPTPTPAPLTPDGEPGQIYIVQEQDTLFSISVRFGTSIEELMAAINMTDDLLSVGQELLVPVPPPIEEPTPLPVEPVQPVQPVPAELGPVPQLESGNIYVVQAGDNLFRIALRFGVSMDAIAQANNIVPPWYVKVAEWRDETDAMHLHVMVIGWIPSENGIRNDIVTANAVTSTKSVAANANGALWRAINFLS